MQAYPTTTTPRKPSKAYYAHLHGIAGALSKVDDTILFFAWDSGVITPVRSYAGLDVLGELGLADTQRLMDDLHGGYAQITTSRMQEVR